jgi:ferredoxin
MRIKVDWDLCQGHGACRSEAPEVFDVDRERQQVVVKLERPPEALHEKVRAAVRYCPTLALSIEEE